MMMALPEDEDFAWKIYFQQMWLLVIKKTFSKVDDKICNLFSWQSNLQRHILKPLDQVSCNFEHEYV